LLDQLRDISGVLGAFLVSSDGVLLGQSLPPERAPRGTAAAQRLPLLLDALAAGQKVQSFSLRFAEHRLYLQSLEGAFLAVLTELVCDTTLLKMTLNIAGKRLACLVQP
jgi:predicted regulator of Ras-like GTPase activity (Roadblock/LC7/MglB family)